MTTLIKYPFDPTGVRPTNLILNEQHDRLDPFTRLLIPKLGMYYTESLVVKDSTRTYALNTDYVPVEFDQTTSLKVGKELCRAIIIKPSNYSLPITITYQVLGDDTTNDRNEVLTRFQELLDYSGTQSFNNLIEVPPVFRSSPHLHNFNEIYGMEYLVNELNRITKAINDTPVPTINSILQHIDSYIELFNNLSQSNLDHFFISRIDEFLLTINRQFLQIENIYNYVPGTLADGLKIGEITTIKESVGTFEFPEKYATIETLIGLRQKIYTNSVTMRSCNIGYESAVYSEPRKNSLYVLNNQQTVTKVSQQTAIEENFPFDAGIYPDPVPVENEITITKISNDVTTNLGLLSSVDSTQEKMYLGRLSFNTSAFDTEWKTFDCTDKIHKLINVVKAHSNDFCEPYGDPHEIIKADIELDKVENLEVVSRDDIIALTSTRKYLTFDSLLYFMRSFLLQNGKKSPIDETKTNNKFLIDNCQLVFSPAGVKCEVICDEPVLDFLKTDQLCILVEPPPTPTPTQTPTPTPTPSPSITTSTTTTTTTTTTPSTTPTPSPSTTLSTTPTPTSLVSPHIPVLSVSEQTTFRKNTDTEVRLSGNVDFLMSGFDYTNEYYYSTDLNSNWIQLGTTDIIVKDETYTTTITAKTVIVNPGQANTLFFRNVVRLVDHFNIFDEYTTNTTNPKEVYPEITAPVYFIPKQPVASNFTIKNIEQESFDPVDGSNFIYYDSNCINRRLHTPGDPWFHVMIDCNFSNLDIDLWYSPIITVSVDGTTSYIWSILSTQQAYGTGDAPSQIKFTEAAAKLTLLLRVDGDNIVLGSTVKFRFELWPTDYTKDNPSRPEFYDNKYHVDKAFMELDIPVVARTKLPNCSGINSVDTVTVPTALQITYGVPNITPASTLSTTTTTTTTPIPTTSSTGAPGSFVMSDLDSISNINVVNNIPTPGMINLKFELFNKTPGSTYRFQVYVNGNVLVGNQDVGITNTGYGWSTSLVNLYNRVTDSSTSITFSATVEGVQSNVTYTISNLVTSSTTTTTTTPSTTPTPSLTPSTTPAPTPVATILNDGVTVQGTIISLDDIKYYKVINTGSQPFDLTFEGVGGTPLAAVKWHCIAEGINFGYINDWEYSYGWWTAQVANNGIPLIGDVIIAVSGRNSIGDFTIKMDRFH